MKVSAVKFSKRTMYTWTAHASSQLVTNGMKSNFIIKQVVSQENKTQ